MELSSVPRAVLQRIIELSEYSEELTKTAAQAERKLAEARDIVNGRRQVAIELHNETKAKFDSIYKNAQALRAHADAEARVVVRVKGFIAACDHNSRFEPVRVDTKGWTLDRVRQRLAVITDEVKDIEAAPKPSDDIKARLEIYVRMLAQAGRPIFHRGLNAAGSDLSIFWAVHPQANSRNLNGYEQLNANPLLFEAWMRPAELLARLVQEVHDISQRPLPPSKRAQRIRELQSEAFDLRFIEEALICAALDNGELPVRQVDVPVEAVLQHKVHAPQREAKEARSQAVA